MQVERRAERMAGVSQGEASLTVTARVEQRAAVEGATWHLELAVRSESGEHTRSLDARRCDALADVTALVLAFGLDPFAGPSPSVADDSTRAEPPPIHRAGARAGARATVRRRPAAPPATISTTSSSPRRSPHAGQEGVGFGFKLLAGGELGALPGGSGGGRLGLGLLTRRLRLEAHGAYWLPRPARIPDGGGMGVDVRLGTGGVDLCLRLYAARRLEFPICAGAEVGLMRADAVGAPEPHRAHSVYAAARLAPALAWRVADWVGLWLGVEGTLAFSRPRFRFGEDEVYTPALGGGRVMAGVEFGY